MIMFYTAGNLVAGFSPMRRPNSDHDNSIGKPSRKKGWRIRQRLGGRLPLAFPKPLFLTDLGASSSIGPTIPNY